MKTLHNQSISSSIVTRQIIINVFSLLLGVVAISFITIMLNTEQYKENKYKSFATYLSSVNNLLSSNLETIGLNLKFIAEGRTIELYQKNNDKAELEKFFDLFSHQMDRMFYVNQWGDIEVSTAKKDRLSPGSSVLDMNIFVSKKESLYNINYGEVQPYNVSETKYIDVFYAFIDNHGEFHGTVGGSVEVFKIKKYYSSIPAINYTNLYFINSENQIIFSGKPEAVGSMVSGDFFETLNTLTPTRTQFLNCDCIVTMLENGVLGWKILLVMSNDDFVAPLAKVIKNGLLVVFLIVLVVIAISIFASNRILKPITLLNNLVSDITHDNDFSRRVSWSSTDELGTLSTSLNRMLDKLQLTTMALSEEKHHSESIIASMADALFITDLNGKIEQVNAAAISLVGCKESDLMGIDISDLLKENSSKMKPSVVYDLFTKGDVKNFDSNFINNNGGLVPITASGSLHTDSHGKSIGAIFVVKDITERKNIEKRLSFLASHDPLTSLPNRTLLMDRLRQSLSRLPWNNRFVSLLFLDLDRFKLINDTLGHHIGDELIISVAERLKKCVREGDTVSRLGGDEFVLMLNDVAHKKDAIEVAEKVLKSLSKPFILDGNEFTITTSVGISIYPDGGKDPHTLMKNADAAMYRVKGSGKNNYVLYSKSISESVEKQLKMENALRRAIEQNEFELYYQPQVDVRQNKIVGVEALIRWNNPEDGFMSPASFLPDTEESGLMENIGDWVVEDAIAQASRWRKAGYESFTVGINIASVQFQRSSFADFIRDLLVKYEVDAHLIDIELTEGIIMHDVDGAQQKIEDLKKLGVKISLDDFGTGYSSLAHLKRFNIDVIKIDQSFIRDIPANKDDIVIVSAIIDLAHSLDIHLIAEGVETIEQANFIKDRECFIAQGYYYSRPISVSEFSEKYKDSLIIHKG